MLSNCVPSETSLGLLECEQGMECKVLLLRVLGKVDIYSDTSSPTVFTDTLISLLYACFGRCIVIGTGINCRHGMCT